MRLPCSDSFRTLNYQRSVYSSKFQRRSPESIGKFAELAGKKAFLLGAGVFNAAVWLQRAGIALINFAVGSGAGHGIDVDDILLSSTTHRKVILDQNAQVIQKANAAILGSGRNRRVSAFVASSGTGQGGQAGNWQYTLTDGKQNPDIQAAYGGLDIATTARVSAVKRGNVWDVTLTITTYVEDPYDWEDYDVATSVSLAPALPSPFPWAGLNNQSDMSELHQYGFAQEYLRSGSSTFTLNYSLVP